MSDKFKAERIVKLHHNCELVWPDNLLIEIAFQLVEIPDDWQIDAGNKEVPAGNGVWHIEPLAMDDFKLVKNICGGNLPLRGTQADFKQFEARFNESESKPSWNLRLERRPSDAMVKAQNRWNDLITQHRAQIERFVHEGKVQLLTPDSIETRDLGKGQMRVDDVKAYLDRVRIAYRVINTDLQAEAEEPDETKAIIDNDSDKPNWDIWRQKMMVTLREAVCLSRNVDPRIVALNKLEELAAPIVTQLLGKSAASKNVCNEISTRLDIARSYTGNGGTLRAVTEGSDIRVRLVEFAAWVLAETNWTVPDELRELANTARPASASPEEVTGGAPLHETDQDAGSRVAWRLAVKNQWPSMLQAHDHKYPGPKKALAWFKANDQEGAFKPPTQNEADDKFRWVGSDSKVRTGVLKTFQNAISEMQLPT
jgi:hypothetical protein